MTVNDRGYSAIETTLLKTPAPHGYTEIIPKTFLISTGVQSWSHEDKFTRELIRRFAIAMATNEAFLGAKRVNHFLFQNFNLHSITVYRNGYPVAGTPLQTEDDNKFQLNLLEALAFGQHGHGVPKNDYSNHYLLVFDLTSTQQRSHDYRYPELTNGSISFSLRFSAQLTNSLEVFFLSERSSTIYIDSSWKVSNTFSLNTKLENQALMDSTAF